MSTEREEDCDGGYARLWKRAAWIRSSIDLRCHPSENWERAIHSRPFSSLGWRAWWLLALSASS